MNLLAFTVLCGAWLHGPLTIHGLNLRAEADIWIGNASINSSGYQIIGKGHPFIGNYDDSPSGRWTGISLFHGNCRSGQEFVDLVNANGSCKTLESIVG